MTFSDERRYFAISVKHTDNKWKFGLPCWLWGSHRTEDEEERCYSGYTEFPNRAELYTIEEFRKQYNCVDFKYDEPVKLCVNFCKKYKNFDTVFIDYEDYVKYCEVADLPLGIIIMTREQVLESNLLKKRFSKDVGIPSSLLENPYFEERLEMYSLDGTDYVEKFNQFCKELESYSNSQEYLEEYNCVKDSVITGIKESPGYKEFTKTDFPDPAIKCNKNLYTEENNGKCFISIDIRKANFTSMSLFSDEIFDGCDSWEKYLGKFTKSTHIKNSKYIREVIFGACNPKHQVRYEELIMSHLLLSITKLFDTKFEHLEDYEEPIKLYSISADEIIFSCGKFDKHSYEVLSRLEEAVKSSCNIIGMSYSNLKINMFTLNKFNVGFALHSHNLHRVDFKCVDGDIYHLVLKKYNNKEISENDLVFEHNGRLAKYIESIDIL